MRNKKAGIAFTLSGAVLIISALLLFINNQNEEISAGKSAESVLERLRAEVITTVADETKEILRADGETTNSSESAGENASETENVPSGAMKKAEIDGREYIGYIEIDKIGCILPVLSEWDYDRLKIAPCRQFGSVKTDDIVIAGHNYKSHFGYLYRLEIGDELTFTDIEGTTTAYTVQKTAILQPTDIEAVQSSGYDLVLYTCTYTGTKRIVVYCDRNIPFAIG